MTRLRFIVDRPRGKRGGHNDERHLYKSLSSAKTGSSAKKGVEYNGRVFRPDRAAGRILTVDLDDLPIVDASIEESFAFHERAALRHTSEMYRLRPHAEGTATAAYMTPEDMAHLRQVVSEWDDEEDRLRRGGGATPAAAGAFFLLRDLWRAGKLGGPR